MTPSSRGTIFLEKARVISQQVLEARQFVLRLAAPRCAAHAEPGSFAHVTCDTTIPMRRPAVDHAGGCARRLDRDALQGARPGLQALASRKVGEELSVLGPIGRPFVAHPERPRSLLLGRGVGIPPMVFLAERLHAAGAAAWKPLVLIGDRRCRSRFARGPPG